MSRPLLYRPAQITDVDLAYVTLVTCSLGQLPNTVKQLTLLMPEIHFKFPVDVEADA